MGLLVCNEYKSPNYNKRKNLDLIDTVIIHYTGMRNAKTALNYLCNKKSKVSAHYFINEEGKLWQIVEDKNIAWHAGVSKWLDRKNLNETSIGIELENPGHQHGYKEFTFDQYEILENFKNDKVVFDFPYAIYRENEKTLNLYNYAIKNRLRFFSYGDACLIWNKYGKI